MTIVSIITPVYNSECFIREAIDSVMAQTCSDWELIVVDDGSTDATPSILSQYNDLRIKVIRQSNGGAAAARNAGLDMAVGQYIALLDADDVYLPNALADFITYLTDHSDIDVVYADGIICDDQRRSLMRLSEHRPGIYTGHILEAVVLSASVITVPVCTMVRRSAIESSHLRFDISLVTGEDWDFWIQLARHARFGYLDKITCLYRVHLTNITRTSGTNKRKNDLIYGRMKVFGSDWFRQLSLPTKQQFLYNLLVNLLADQPEKQEAILHQEQCKVLPPSVQAALWRQVGTDYLVRRSVPIFAIKCLETAVHIWPSDARGRSTLWAVHLVGVPLMASALYIWQIIHKLVVQARSLGQRKPKPVPTSLGPYGP